MAVKLQLAGSLQNKLGRIRVKLFGKNLSTNLQVLSMGKKLKIILSEFYFLTLDFDKGDPSMEKHIELSSSSKHCWLLHTTLNHRDQQMMKERKSVKEI